ncbi:hypothethical protein (plasmid) [Ralstonia solanacearum CMR15]|nr:hypothethical protein [Ralstonia solanacearum CMR15]
MAGRVNRGGGPPGSGLDAGNQSTQEPAAPSSSQGGARSVRIDSQLTPLQSLQRTRSARRAEDSTVHGLSSGTGPTHLYDPRIYDAWAAPHVDPFQGFSASAYGALPDIGGSGSAPTYPVVGPPDSHPWPVPFPASEPRLDDARALSPGSLSGSVGGDSFGMHPMLAPPTAPVPIAQIGSAATVGQYEAAQSPEPEIPPRGRKRARDPEDAATIDAFVAKARATIKPRTVDRHALALTNFSDHLLSKAKGPLRDRLDDPTLLDDAKAFTKAPGGDINAHGALKALLGVRAGAEVFDGGTHVVLAADRKLIEQWQKACLRVPRANKSTVRSYAVALRAFSEWLFGKNKGGLAARRSDPTLDDDLQAFLAEGGDRCASFALPSLKEMNASTGVAYLRKTQPSKALIDQFERTELEKKGAGFNEVSKGSIAREKAALLAFGRWLQETGQPAMAARLYEQGLDDDLDRFLETIHAGPADDGEVRHALTVIRLKDLAHVSELFSSPRRSFDEVADLAGIPGHFLRQFFNDASGEWVLTDRGLAHVKRLGDKMAALVHDRLQLRNQLAAGQGAQPMPQPDGPSNATRAAFFQGTSDFLRANEPQTPSESTASVADWPAQSSVPQPASPTHSSFFHGVSDFLRANEPQTPSESTASMADWPAQSSMPQPVSPTHSSFFRGVSDFLRANEPQTPSESTASMADWPAQSSMPQPASPAHSSFFLGASDFLRAGEPRALTESTASQANSPTQYAVQDVAGSSALPARHSGLNASVRENAGPGVAQRGGAAPGGDKALMDRFRKSELEKKRVGLTQVSKESILRERRALLAFSLALQEQGKQGIADRLYAPTLDDDLDAFLETFDGPADDDEIRHALTAIRLDDLGHLSDLLSDPRRSVEDVARLAGMPGLYLQQFFSDASGALALTDRGLAYVGKLGDRMMTLVNANLQVRARLTAQQALQLAPEPGQPFSPVQSSFFQGASDFWRADAPRTPTASTISGAHEPARHTDARSARAAGRWLVPSQGGAAGAASVFSHPGNVQSDNPGASGGGIHFIQWTGRVILDVR